VGFGGAGPVHANALAKQAGIRRVLIPPGPGVTSALGLLVSDVRHEAQRTVLVPLENARWDTLNEVVDELHSQVIETLDDEGIAPDCQTTRRIAEMRYIGQSYELRVMLPAGKLEASHGADLREAFFAEHRRAYGYATDQADVEIVTLRVAGTGQVPRPQIRQLPSATEPVDLVHKATRAVYFAETAGFVSTSIYDRYRLAAGHCIPGPAVIEEMDSTVIVHPDWCATVDRYGNLLLENKAT
jgi:N-methylhydantoinase A